MLLLKKYPWYEILEFAAATVMASPTSIKVLSDILLRFLRRLDNEEVEREARHFIARQRQGGQCYKTFLFVTNNTVK
jgi:hypothetical protein